jgi:hypothetical protein
VITQSIDTSPESERVLIELLRRTPIWRRLQLAYEMSAAAREMARAGLRLRYPDASEKELQRRFADLHLGPELAQEVYGPLEASYDRRATPGDWPKVARAFM